jgi:hypothetical protein
VRTRRKTIAQDGRVAVADAAVSSSRGVDGWRAGCQG